MGNSSYIALSRQSGLFREMQVVANNIANMSTTGYRKEGVVFSEFVQALDGRAPSVSMATGDVRTTIETQGALSETGNRFDLAIEGPGYFLLDTPDGRALTRAGNFTPNANGELVTPQGHRLLDAGAAPVFVPADARSVSIASDGTLSVDGDPVAQLGLYKPANPADLLRSDGVMFMANGGVEPADGGSIVQGFLEESNVSPVAEIARMIEVQRAYELGQGLMEKEDSRIRRALETLGK